MTSDELHHSKGHDRATITSAAENAFLASLASFPSFAEAWIGGDSSSTWLVGPEAGKASSYDNWGGVEPKQRRGERRT